MILTELQDGMLTHYLQQAGQSDVNVERRIEREPFDMRSQAENFWRQIAPELTPPERTQVALIFGGHRQTDATLRAFKALMKVNDAHGWNAETTGFVNTTFGRLIFLGDE